MSGKAGAGLAMIRAPVAAVMGLMDESGEESSDEWGPGWPTLLERGESALCRHQDTAWHDEGQLPIQLLRT